MDKFDYMGFDSELSEQTCTYYNNQLFVIISDRHTERLQNTFSLNEFV